MRLTNRVAVVTGAASGIGKEIARTFVREGAKVAIADLNQAGADAAAAELGGPERRAIGVAMDVTSEEQVEAGMAKAVKTFGRLDILVSNAGIQIVAPLDQFDFGKWKQMLAIHLDGAFLTKAGQSFSELPGDRHGVSANASKTQPAKLLAVFVVDTNETELTIPFGN